MIREYLDIWRTLLAYNEKESDPRSYAVSLLIWPPVIGALAAVLYGLRGLPILGVMVGFTVLAHIGAYVNLVLGAGARASKVEDVLPDFLSLVASNIRAGLTPDKALIVSARPEFGPLAEAVMNAAKNSVTGMPLDQVMTGIGARIRSETLEKTIKLIVEGLHSGGDMAELLERTAFDLRKFRSVRNETNSIILNYVLFIMAAIAFGAPLLYGIASFLVEIMLKIKSKISTEDMGSAVGQVSIFKGKLAFTPDAVTMFAVLSITITALFGCMAVGVMSTGKRVDGLKYFPIVWLLALGVLFFIKIGLQTVLGGLMGG